MTAPMPLELFWLSGSPFAWRAMIALEVKGLAYASRRLDFSAGENRAPAFLALNPRGQVPVLRHGDIVVCESLAILAYLDRAFPEPAFFGRDPRQGAAIWQATIEFENNGRALVTTIAQIVFRGQDERAAELATAATSLLGELAALNHRLAAARFLTGDALSAADIAVFPCLQMVRRAILKKADKVPVALRDGLGELRALAAWEERMCAMPWFDATYPPHWRDAPR